MFELRLLKLVVLFFLLIPPLFIYFVIMKDDHNFIRVMKGVSNSEAYQAMKLEGNRNLEVKISFSDFYDCLLTYKPLWKRNIPKGNPSEDYYLEVLVSPNDLLLFNVRSGITGTGISFCVFQTLQLGFKSL